MEMENLILIRVERLSKMISISIFIILPVLAVVSIWLLMEIRQRMDKAQTDLVLQGNTIKDKMDKSLVNDDEIKNKILDIAMHNDKVNSKLEEMAVKGDKIKNTLGNIVMKEDEIKKKEETIMRLDEEIKRKEEEIRGFETTITDMPKKGMGSLMKDRAVAVVPHHIYIHIKEESQREGAKNLAKTLRLAGYVVPEIENVGSRAGKQVELRYCEFKGQPTDAERIHGLLAGAKIAITKTRLLKALNFPSCAKAGNAQSYEIWLGSDFKY